MDGVAMLALVKPLTGVRGHLLSFAVAAFWACQD